MNHKNILITGGAGFVGSHLARALLEVGHSVTVYDNLSMGRKENIPSGATFILGDVTDYNELQSALTGIQVVIHLAARVSIRDSADRFHEDAQTNLFGTINLLRAMKGTNVKRVVFSSSMAVYADSYDKHKVTEDYRQEPISAYGISKLASEKYLLLMCRELGIKATVLRYFNIYGPGQIHSPYVGVMTIFINRLLDGKAPIVFGDGRQVRDFISVHDVVDATIAAMNYSGEIDVFNVGTGIGTSVNDIAHMLIRKINPSLNPESKAGRPGELKNSVANVSRTRMLLGFESRRFIEGSLDEIIGAIRVTRQSGS